MKWVLILSIWQTGVTTAEFHDEAACKRAISAMQRTTNSVNAVCVPKATPCPETLSCRSAK